MSMQEEHKQKELQAKLEAKAQIVHNNSTADNTKIADSTEKNDTLQNYLNQEKLLDEILQIREELKVSLNFL